MGSLVVNEGYMWSNSQLGVAVTRRWRSHAANGELGLNGLDLHSKCVPVAQALAAILLYEALGVACCAVRSAMAIR
jgi:hypothetical protein